jgi:hypothetical protein
MRQTKNTAPFLLVPLMALLNGYPVAVASDATTANPVGNNPQSTQIDIDGTWSGTAQTHNGICSWRLTNLQFNDSLSGSFSGSGTAIQTAGPAKCGGGANGLLSGYYNPNNGDLSFGLADGVFRVIRFDGTARDGNTMSGNWAGRTNDGTWALFR